MDGKMRESAKKAIGDAEVGILLKGPAPREGWEEYYRV